MEVELIEPSGVRWLAPMSGVTEMARAGLVPAGTLVGPVWIVRYDKTKGWHVAARRFEGDPPI